ncbi:MAG: hypothetical protein ACRDKZ_12165 [Actinomycetota bacterium]
MSREFSASLDGVTSGRLRFPSGSAELALGVDPETGDLYRARFEEPVPTVEVQRGMVVVRYHQRHAHGTRARPSELVLNGSIPWDIELLGGVANVTADLRTLELASLTLDGGVSEVLVNLPHPRGTISVRASGGANEVTLARPAGVPAGVKVLDGGRYLSLDDQYFGAVGGETRWAGPGYAIAADRYDIVVSGGAHALTLETR